MTNLLTAKELEEIELIAAKEVEDELKAEAREKAIASAKERIKKKAFFKEGKNEKGRDVEVIRINLGKHADRIVMDGVTYMNGREYSLTKDKIASIKDMAFRTHLHQAEIKGKNFLRDFYGARPYNAVVS